MDHPKSYFIDYVIYIITEMDNRKIKYQGKYYLEILHFCKKVNGNYMYPEHNNRYLLQCYYNLQEQYDRGIINELEWNRIKETVNVAKCLMYSNDT